MKEDQIASVSRLLFQLEESILSISSVPLSSIRQLVRLLEALIPFMSGEETARFHVEQLHRLIKQKLQRQSFFVSEADELLLTWLCQFRSLYLSCQFDISANWQALEPLYARLFTLSKEEGGLEYVGRFAGTWGGCLEDLESLSELGYWTMQECSNKSFEEPGNGDFSVSVRLCSPLALAQLARFDRWQWLSYKKSENSPPVEHSAEYPPVDLLRVVHVLASERETWRQNDALARLYKTLQEFVQQHTAIALDEVSGLAYRTGLMVVKKELDSLQLDGLSDILLTRGQVYLQFREGRCQVLPLAVSSLPVYRITFAEQVVVVPAFRLLFDQVPEAVAGTLVVRANRWCLLDSESVPSQQERLLHVRIQGRLYSLAYEYMERDYGVVLQANYLPTDVLNIWQVRGHFLLEPRAMEESLALREIAANPVWQQNHWGAQETSPMLGCRLASSMLLLVCYEWVNGILPWRSVSVLPGSFVYHSGCVMPLIHVSDRETEHDVVVFLCVCDTRFAFRVANITNEPHYELLEKWGGIVLDWHDDRLCLTSTGEGCALFDEDSAFVIHQQLLEMLK